MDGVDSDMETKVLPVGAGITLNSYLSLCDMPLQLLELLHYSRHLITEGALSIQRSGANGEVERKAARAVDVTTRATTG